jgi:hypothetical protein
MNRLKEMGQSKAWHLLVGAALEGARQQGYTLQKQPGRGLSNTYSMTKGNEKKVASVRTTRDRWIAFPPMNGGLKWKTLDEVSWVLVAAVDNKDNPQNVDVYLFPADEVRDRFNASYAARQAAEHTLPDNYGMWVMLDQGDDAYPSQVGHSLAVDYPTIARFTLDELEKTISPDVRKMADDDAPAFEEVAQRDAPEENPHALTNVAEVLTFAREKIAALTGMPSNAITLDLKMGV